MQEDDEELSRLHFAHAKSVVLAAISPLASAHSHAAFLFVDVENSATAASLSSSAALADDVDFVNQGDGTAANVDDDVDVDRLLRLRNVRPRSALGDAKMHASPRVGTTTGATARTSRCSDSSASPDWHSRSSSAGIAHGISGGGHHVPASPSARGSEFRPIATVLASMPPRLDRSTLDSPLPMRSSPFMQQQVRKVCACARIPLFLNENPF